jgi:hypothetical protein
LITTSALAGSADKASKAVAASISCFIDVLLIRGENGARCNA